MHNIATPNTRTRCLAENSLTSSMSYLCNISTIYYDVSINKNEMMTKKMVRHNNVPEEVSLLYKISCKAYKRSILLVPVEYYELTSTEDTTGYIYK